MKRSIAIGLVVAAGGTLQAQEMWRWSGYVLDLPIVSYIRTQAAQLLHTDRTQLSNITRMRLRPEFLPWDQGRIAMEYEMSAYYHSARTLLNTLTVENNRQVASFRWNLVDSERWLVQHFVDRLYFQQSFSWMDLTIGRQRIAWGSGRVWNPTDLFNPLNPAALGKIEKDGVDATLAKIRLGNFTDVSAVWNPQRDWHRHNAGVRFRTNVSEFDISALGGSFDDRAVGGLDIAGNLFDAGVRFEGAWTGPSSGFAPVVARYIVGVDYQFTADIYGLAEFHHNGTGSSDRRSYNLLALARGEVLNLACDYVAISSTILLHPLVTFSLTSIANLNDGSGFVNGSAAYAATDELSIALGAQVFWGEILDEYWYYPSSLYLKTDIYF